MKARLLKAGGALLVLFLLFYIITPDAARRFDDYSTVVLDADGQMLRAFLNEAQQWCFPDDGTAIPPKLIHAVLQFEDRDFYRHPGVNPLAVARALMQNIRERRVVSGASTITMQVARISNPKRRTVWHKMREAAEALKLEIRYSKKQILRLYLHHAPYGYNIVGIRAASLKYFGKEPAWLTWSEAAVLAVLPNAPGLIAPGTRQEKLRARRDDLLHALHRAGSIDAATLRISLQEPVPQRIFPMPMNAPHAAQLLKSRTDEDIIHSTISAQIQHNAEAVLRNNASVLRTLGVRNCAALICKTDTGEVVAYCGSQDFGDFATDGQVDGLQAARSSASTLKPFLYALSIDRGLIVPQSIISDIPTYYDGFTPQNADHSYRGTITAHQALVHSLNVPAVRLLNSYSVIDFYDFLQQAGCSTLFRNADGYGLTLIIGGAEVTPWDLAGLFRGLGCGGAFAGLSLQQDHPVEVSRQLIRPGAAWLTVEMLKDLVRPGAEYYWQQYEDAWPIAWKTGTSYGQRDAWAAGVSPQWTIVVWAGNFDGEGNASLSGAASAGPVLFELFGMLPKDPQKRWFKPPLSEMDIAVICHETGFTAQPACARRDTILVPHQTYPLPLCRCHRIIQVNDDETQEVCSLCWDANGHHDMRVLQYPPVESYYRRKRGLRNSFIPPHNPSCPAFHDEAVVTIQYPTQDAHVLIPRDFGGTRQRVTLRAAHRDVDALLYWYLDDEYLGITQQHHTKAVEMRSGTHQLTVEDPQGNRCTVRFFAEQRR
jgi:penicillin-binding protein 1C